MVLYSDSGLSDAERAQLDSESNAVVTLDAILALFRYKPCLMYVLRHISGVFANATLFSRDQFTYENEYRGTPGRIIQARDLLQQHAYHSSLPFTTEFQEAVSALSLFYLRCLVAASRRGQCLVSQGLKLD